MYQFPITNYWLDLWADFALKMYYWPFFLAGNMDNIRDISMCRFSAK